ncbi:hypothetical protein EI94DRAFT_1704075 [Lactarius quietus]|nr:hypothetical protein EI94DRAFT_1704075 [Lactarius quietus]
MAPRTRQASKSHDVNQTLQGTNNSSFGDCTEPSIFVQQGVEGQPIAYPTPHHKKTCGKRTFTSRDGHSGAITNLPEANPTPVKKAQPQARIASINSPSHLVQLMTGEGTPRQQYGRPRQDEKASFYPGLNGVNSILDVESDNLADSINDEAQFKEEDDWIDVQSAVEPSRIQTSKFPEALALEQPMWKVSDLTAGLYKPPFHFPASDGTGPTISTAPSIPPITGPLSPPLPPSSPNTDDAVTLKPTSSPLPSTAQTDLRVVPGSTRIILTGQQPIVCMVIQEAIDNVRASLLFVDAFPDSNCALKYIQDGLITSAERQCPAAADVLMRLQEDNEYMSAIVPLPRARISIMRGEVKDRLVAMTQTTFRGKASPMEAAAYVQEQLSNYNYTYPRGPRVPDVMVALAATALYAVLYEWRTGKLMGADFSSSLYMDTYEGHMNTLKEIRTRRSGAYHAMMADIYLQANNTSTSSAGAPSGAIDFQELEE